MEREAETRAQSEQGRARMMEKKGRTEKGKQTDRALSDSHTEQEVIERRRRQLKVIG